jgi:anaerobic selenocysteine-containing dehydrogenase
MARTTVIGACPHDCPDTCSILTTVEDGKAIAVRGNPDHPFTRGRLCVKVNNYEERVYSDKRVLFPLKRVGAKCTRQFQRISWNEAIDTIATRWKSIIADHGAQAILPYSYLGTQGIINGLNVGDPLFNKLGATVSERTFCDSGSRTAYMMTIGPTPGVDPESFVHSKFILLWACNTLSTNSHHWPFIEQAKESRRQAGGDRSSPDAHRAAGRLAHSDSAGHRRGVGAGDDSRHHQGRPGRPRLYRQTHCRLQ